MRILYSHRIQSHDGQGVHIEALVGALRAAGHEVLVVGPGFYQAEVLGGESRGLALLRRLLPGFLGELAELAYNIPAYWRLKSAWRRFRPDVLYERCNLYFLAGAWLARRHGMKLLLEVNSPLAEERAMHGGLRLAWLARWLEHWTWRSADHVLPVTRVLADILVANRVDPSRIQVIPNGVHLARFQPRAPRPERRDTTLGFVGFVRAWHGLDLVIEGLARGASATRLVVVGEGPAVPDLKALAERLGVTDRIRFTGLVQPEAVPAILADIDIALQPSATAYASPLKLFDYMAASCAIVAPDQPNIREILVHGQTAMLFDPARPAAMWQVVEALIADRTLRERLQQTAREVLETADYTWRGNASRVAALAARS